MRNRTVNIRVDDHIRRTTVKNARELIFDQGIPLDSDRLKDVLSKFSGIPTHVSPGHDAICLLADTNPHILERLFD
jgi:hypothetical protein